MQVPTGTDLHIHICAHRDAHLWLWRHRGFEAHTHTCVWATGLAPLFSCERKKRMDMKSSWMQTRNSSSLWPPVANEKRRRDWIMYLKMYSLAWRTERIIIVYHLCFPWWKKKKKPCESDIPFGVTVKEWHDITFFKSLNFMIYVSDRKKKLCKLVLKW